MAEEQPQAKPTITALEIGSTGAVKNIRVDRLYTAEASERVSTLPIEERRLIPGKKDVRGNRTALPELWIPTSAQPENGQSVEDWLYSRILQFYPSSRMEPYFFGFLDSANAVAKGQTDVNRAFAAQGDPACGKSFAARFCVSLLTGLEHPNDVSMIDATGMHEAEELFADITINSNGSTTAPAVVVDGELTLSLREGMPTVLDEVNHIHKTGALHGIAEMMAGSINTITINAKDNEKFQVSRSDLPDNYFTFLNGNEAGQGSALPFPEPVISRLGHGFGFYNIPETDAQDFAVAFAGHFLGMRGAKAQLEMYGEAEMEKNPDIFIRVLETGLKGIYFGKEIPEEVYWRSFEWQKSMEGCDKVGELLFDLKQCFAGDGLETKLQQIQKTLGLDDSDMRGFQTIVSEKIQKLKPEIDERIIPKLFELVEKKSKETYKPPINLHLEGQEVKLSDLRIHDNDPVRNFGDLLYRATKEWLETTIVEPMRLKGDHAVYMSRLVDEVMKEAGLHPQVPREENVINSLNIDVNKLKLQRSARKIQANAFAIYKQSNPNSEERPDSLFPITKIVEQLGDAVSKEGGLIQLSTVPVDGARGNKAVMDSIVTDSPDVEVTDLMDVRQFILSLSMPVVGDSNIENVFTNIRSKRLNIGDLSEADRLASNEHNSGLGFVAVSTFTEIDRKIYQADIKIVANNNTGSKIVILPEHTPDGYLFSDELKAQLQKQKVHLFTAGSEARLQELSSLLQSDEFNLDDSFTNDLKRTVGLAFDTSKIERDEDSGNIAISLEELLLKNIEANSSVSQKLLSHNYRARPQGVSIEESVTGVGDDRSVRP